MPEPQPTVEPWVEPEPPPRLYATPEEVERRLGGTLEGMDRDRLEALIEDASALIRAVAGGDWRDRVPPVVTVVCINMVQRAWHNPEGVRQQTMGDLSMTYGSIETGVTITKEERHLIRAAAGFGVEIDSVQLTSGYGTSETIYVEVEGGGDWLPWGTVGRR